MELEEELRRRVGIRADATIFTHQLERLLGLAKATDRLRRDKHAWRQFNRVNRWVPAWRYMADLSNRDDATEFLQDVEKVLQWIENNI